MDVLLWSMIIAPTIVGVVMYGGAMLPSIAHTTTRASDVSSRWPVPAHTDNPTFSYRK